MPTPPVFVPDELVTASKLNLLPKGIVGSAITTTTQTGISAIADVTGLTVTWTAAGGRYYKITGSVQIFCSASGDSPHVYITTSANVIVAIAQHTISAASSPYVRFAPIALVTPSAGSVTYKIRALGGGATLQAQATATQPNLLIVEDLGAV